jgi:NSS family neurotransmitter:Na+ symporter
MITNPGVNMTYMLIVVVIGFLVLSFNLQGGLKRVTKYMMVALLFLMVILAVNSATMDGAAEGLKFYLVPSFKNMKDAGVAEVISAAMGQAFFTLSIGIGSVAIFGSYIGKERRLLSEAATIISLDTFVAITAGLIVFPACFTYNNGGGLDVGNANAGFLFTTLSSIFNQMPGGRIVGALFFLFMMFAAFSTVIAVFENIVSFWLELTNLKRWTICLINIGIMMVLVLPAIFSNSIWADIKLFGLGFMDLEDTIVSKWLLPLGSLVYVAFCTYRFGWGSKNFLKEVNTGKGPKYPAFMVPYMKFVLPLVILVVFALSFVKF